MSTAAAANGTSGAISVLRLEFPHPEVFACPLCYAGAAAAVMKGRGTYKKASDLCKHVKHHHPDLSIVWVCGICGYTGKGVYPQKDVKRHHAATHEQGQATIAVRREVASRRNNKITASTSSIATTNTTTNTRTEIRLTGTDTNTNLHATTHQTVTTATTTATLTATTATTTSTIVTNIKTNTSVPRQTILKLKRTRTTSCPSATSTTTTTTTTTACSGDRRAPCATILTPIQDLSEDIVARRSPPSPLVTGTVSCSGMTNNNFNNIYSNSNCNFKNVNSSPSFSLNKNINEVYLTPGGRVTRASVALGRATSCPPTPPILGVGALGSTERVTPGDRRSSGEASTPPSLLDFHTPVSSGCAVPKVTPPGQPTKRRTRTASVRPPQCEDNDDDDADFAPRRIPPPKKITTTVGGKGKGGATSTSGRVTRASTLRRRASSCPPTPPAPSDRKSASPRGTAKVTTRLQASRGKAPIPPGAAGTSSSSTTTNSSGIALRAGRAAPSKRTASTTSMAAAKACAGPVAGTRTAKTVGVISNSHNNFRVTPPSRKSPPGARTTSGTSKKTPPGTHSMPRRLTPRRSGATPPGTSGRTTPVKSTTSLRTTTQLPASSPLQRSSSTPARSWPTPPAASPLTTFADVVKGTSPPTQASTTTSPVAATTITTATSTIFTGGRPITTPAITPSAFGLVPVAMLPCLTRNFSGGPASPLAAAGSSLHSIPEEPAVVSSPKAPARRSPATRSEGPGGSPRSSPSSLSSSSSSSSSPSSSPSPPLPPQRQGDPSEASSTDSEPTDTEEWTPVRTRRGRRAGGQSDSTVSQQPQRQQQQQPQQHQQRRQQLHRQSPPPAGASEARSDAGRVQAVQRPTITRRANPTNMTAGCRARPGVCQPALGNFSASSCRLGTARGCSCTCTCGHGGSTVAARRGGRVPRGNAPSGNGLPTLSAPGPMPATPLGGRRCDENVATSSVSERNGVRNPPPPDSSGRNRIRGVANGEMLSARAAAARTRATLVEEANAAQTSDDLDSLARKLAQIFPARRALRTSANSRNARGASAGRPRRANTATQPEQGSSSQVSGTFPTRDGWVREASRIQKLYRANPKRAVGEILNKDSPFCEVPKDIVQRHFTETFSRTEGAGPLPAPREMAEPSAESNDALVSPLKRLEVLRRLRRMKNSSPGPDGVTYDDMKRADPDAAVLTAVYNACFRLGYIPHEWKESLIVLIHKKGDRNDLKNWRPIAMGDVVIKLFAAVLADRLTSWATANDRLSPAQKGFLPHEGCLEHSFVLQRLIEDARKRKKEVVVAWLDLADAFGSVPHAVIQRTLVDASVPARVVDIVMSLYRGSTVRVRTREGVTGPIPMLSGVRQGCPLSPILFNLVIDPLVRGPGESGAGFEVAGERIAALAYADDVALVTTSPTSMGSLLFAAEETARSLGLSFNPRKCATLHIGAKGEPIPTAFQMAGQDLPVMDRGDSYLHLGVPTGVRVDQTPYATIQDLVVDLNAVSASLLAPWQKVEVVATFLLPRLDFLLRGGAVRKTPLTEADRILKRTVKEWLCLPQRASAEIVFIPPSWGGCGILPLADLADVTAVAHAFRMLNADDPTVARIASSTLEQVVSDKIRRPATEVDIAGYLSGSLEGDLARPSNSRATFWSNVRSAALRSARRLGFRWRWDSERRELALECLARGGRCVIIPPSAKQQVIGRMRAALAEHYASRLLSKKDQGGVFDASTRHGVSNHFIRTGHHARFADWRFIHRARLDVLPLNGARRWGEGDERCRRCGCELETLPHLLCHCGPHAATRQLRHNCIVERLAAASRLPGDLRVNQRVPGVGEDLTALRPDLVVTHEPSRTVVVIDVTVPFENTFEALEKARLEKILKYQPLADSLRGRGYTIHVDGFVVGALGAWHPWNDRLLALLRVSSGYAGLMRRLMVSETIAWSRDMYVEHVSGIRQYRVADAGDLCVETPASGETRNRSGCINDDGGANPVEMS